MTQEAETEGSHVPDQPQQLNEYEKHTHLPKTKEWAWTHEMPWKQGFNDSLARSSVWWSGLPRAVTISILSPSLQGLSSGSSLAEYSGVDNLLRCV